MIDERLFREEVVAEKQNRLHGEVMLKQPLSTRAMVLALVACIGAAAFWVSTGKFARTEQVRGILVTTQPSAKIFAHRPGLVIALKVTEGSLVRQGDRIATVDTDLASLSGKQTAASNLLSLKTRLALADRQANVALDHAAARRMQLRMQLGSIGRRIGDTEAQIDIQREIVESNLLLFGQVEKLVERGFVSRVDYERRRQNLLTSRQGMSRLRQELEQLQAEGADTKTELDQLDLVAIQQMAEIQGNSEALEQQKSQIEGEQGYIITAPISGRVTAVQTAVGRRVGIERPLLAIVPEGAELRADVYAPTRAIGFVRPGQGARLLFDAFPYQRFGSYGGRIEDISRIVIDPREADVPFHIEEPVYRLSVAIERQSVVAFGQQFPLQPGMTLTANIILEEQSFLEWLLTPLRAVLNRS